MGVETSGGRGARTSGRRSGARGRAAGMTTSVGCGVERSGRDGDNGDGSGHGECGTKHGPDRRVGVKSIPPEKVFKETKNSDDSTRVRCNFYDSGSNDKKVRSLFFPFVHLALCSLTLLTLVTNTH